MSEINSVVRALSIISCLRGRSLTGMSHGEIAAATKLPAATATRILATLVAENFAIQLDSGRYALSVRMLQIAQAHANEMTRAQDRINELQQRVHAGANN
jgi:DNA-binding IclR family transcriptional regulator